MLQTILNAFSVPEIRKKLAFTAAMLLLYRLGAYIPAPGVDINTVKSIEQNFSGNSILGFLNLFSGGSLSRLSLFALGIMPYITASIILQLMTVVVPSLERLQKEGEVGRRMPPGGQTSLPLRVNMAGVIPVIFAASIMAFPPTIGQLLGQSQNNFWTDFANFFNPGGWQYVVGEVFFIVIFTYFYTAVTFNPVDQADNLKKYGGFIPGVRPGRPTAEYLDRILSRLTFPGALYLGAVAAMPTILINQTSANFFFGGTSILIVIGVALDTVKQLEAQLMMRNYEGFLK